ncbi:MAG: hypothetical protein KDJ65_36370 [Anaerolineae bacterium]|nr:hypothetical protein [Anaerolineae bacterium]
MITLHVSPDLLAEFNQHKTEFDVRIELEKMRAALREVTEAGKVAGVYFEQLIDVTDWQSDYISGLVEQLSEAIKNAETFLEK